MLVLPLLLAVIPTIGAAQSQAGSDERPDRWWFAAEDFGLSAAEITFSRDIAPILQRSCVQCHNQGGVGPMALETYDQVRPWAPIIMDRTAIRDRMGSMPPFYVERGIGIQEFKDDPSLTDQELAMIQAWVANGAPEGDPADMPPLRSFADGGWTIGEPDLILRGPDFTMPAIAPDWWGNIGLVPTGLTEDRWVQSVEVREVNDIPQGDGSVTTSVGGNYIFHHMTYVTGVLNEEGTGFESGTSLGWPIHEVGRNADLFPERVGMLLQANSAVDLRAAHMHANGRETTGHLEFAFKFYPEGHEPEYRRRGMSLGNGNDMDVMPGRSDQEIHSYRILDQHTKIMAFEPHLHAPGTRMCLNAIWGDNILTLNCVGYDHNWVKQYVYEDHSAPLLPKGTILHVVGFLDTTDSNANLLDSRNWAGGGRRSIANMFIDLGWSVSLTEEQFQREMAERREWLEKTEKDYDIACPLCLAPVPQEFLLEQQQDADDR